MEKRYNKDGKYDPDLSIDYPRKGQVCAVLQRTKEQKEDQCFRGKIIFRTTRPMVFYNLETVQDFLIMLGIYRKLTLFSEKVLIYNKCIRGLMPNLTKKSWTDFILHVLKVLAVGS